MKTTREMIEVMEAYERGEKIEYIHDMTEDWTETKQPVWDWYGCDYRIEPKKAEQEPKFKIGDTLINKKNCDGSPLITSYLYTIKDIGTEQYYFINDFFTKEYMDIKNIDELYINIDDCLWYWEILREDGEWEQFRTRHTRKYLVDNYTFSNEEFKTLVPLYALGARLPKEQK